MPTILISASVRTDDRDHALRAAEVLARAAAGLFLNGVSVSVSVGRPPDDEDDDPRAWWG